MLSILFLIILKFLILESLLSIYQGIKLSNLSSLRESSFFPTLEWFPGITEKYTKLKRSHSLDKNQERSSDTPLICSTRFSQLETSIVL